MPRALRLLPLVLALSAGVAAAQGGEKGKGKGKGFKGGRIPVKRDQGSAKALKAKFEALLRTIKQRAAEKAKQGDPKPAKTPEKKKKKKKEKDGGIAPPPRKQPASRPVDPAEQALLKTLRSFAPDKPAILDGLNPDGVRAIGKKLFKRMRKLFSGDVDAIIKRLHLDPANSKVEVFQVSTEDLRSMDFGTVAAREFARALRRSARLLRGQYHWYCVLMTRPKAKPDDKGVRLQLFFHHKKRYVYLGKLWRLDDE